MLFESSVFESLVCILFVRSLTTITGMESNSLRFSVSVTGMLMLKVSKFFTLEKLMDLSKLQDHENTGIVNVTSDRDKGASKHDDAPWDIGLEIVYTWANLKTPVSQQVVRVKCRPLGNVGQIGQLASVCLPCVNWAISMYISKGNHFPFHELHLSMREHLLMRIC